MIDMNETVAAKTEPTDQRPDARPDPRTDVTPEACCGGGVSRLDATQASELAHALAALADPVRLRMLSIITSSSTGEVCACDFVGPIEKSQPTVSHHLKVLAEAGLVTGDKRGRWVWYRVAPHRLDDLLATLAHATERSPGTSAGAH
jgi:ArsR family transcriptional regulator